MNKNKSLMVTGQQHQYREAWLDAAVDLMRPHFKRAGYDIPGKMRVSCGWPSSGGCASKKRTIGQCWPAEADSKGVHQLFISPFLESVADAQGVLATLVHEVVHAVVGLDKKHNKLFKKCALAVGLDGKMTATFAGEALLAEGKAWAEKLGSYPNGKLDLSKSPVKRQKNRQRKCECLECGYVCRTTKKWLDEMGPPHCPKHGAMTPEEVDEAEEEGDE